MKSLRFTILLFHHYAGHDLYASLHTHSPSYSTAHLFLINNLFCSVLSLSSRFSPCSAPVAAPRTHVVCLGCGANRPVKRRLSRASDRVDGGRRVQGVVHGAVQPSI